MSTPISEVMLGTLATFGQYGSDKLSWETKSGQSKRTCQRMYNGLLPSGASANGDELLMADPAD